MLAFARGAPVIARVVRGRRMLRRLGQILRSLIHNAVKYRDRKRPLELALAIVERATRALGGSCELSSVLDGGTRIVIRLPRA